MKPFAWTGVGVASAVLAHALANAGVAAAVLLFVLLAGLTGLQLRFSRRKD